MKNGQTVSDAEPLEEEHPEESSIEPGSLDPQKVRVVDVEEKKPVRFSAEIAMIQTAAQPRWET